MAFFCGNAYTWAIAKAVAFLCGIILERSYFLYHICILLNARIKHIIREVLGILKSGLRSIILVFRNSPNNRGANYTRKRLPVKLVYFEEYDRIEDAFKQEKQVQNWGHVKIKALIEGNKLILSESAKKIFERPSSLPE